MKKAPNEMTNMEVRLEILRLKRIPPILADPAKVHGQIQRYRFLLDLREKGSAAIPPNQLTAIAKVQRPDGEEV